jgi:hypothetical protein
MEVCTDRQQCHDDECDVPGSYTPKPRKESLPLHPQLKRSLPFFVFTHYLLNRVDYILCHSVGIPVLHSLFVLAS